MNNSQESNQIYICPVCGNTDIHSIGYLNGKPYCRRCISFKGEEVEHKSSYPKKAPIHLSYELSPEQKELSDKLVENYKKGIDSLVFAVCGSGKTELTYKLFQYSLNKGHKVAFVVPRRDVVIELYQRYKEVFSKNNILAIYGGNTANLVGDLLIMTSHQLFRFKNYFDLIVMDEIDAFPFEGNRVLQRLFFKALRGNYVLMSATPSKRLLNNFKKEGKDILRLFKRYHGNPIPVPTFIRSYFILKIYTVIKNLRKFQLKNEKCFIFVPVIEMAKALFYIINMFIKGGNYVSSKREGREDIISDFKNGKYWFLVTTAVLERGVTVERLNVIIYRADHNIYSVATLVQIAGRVGRKASFPTGEVLFIADKCTKEMSDAIKEIKRYNSDM